MPKRLPGIRPVKISCGNTGEKIEQCCNYEIRDAAGKRLRLNSSTHRLMSHMRDTGVRWS